ncbi:MAG: hypothetical protein LBH28_07035, partial [Oscillospiraceae bacterium]|nr:hypothetical protein [Oscillospiraceae bacterium]
MYKIYKPFRIGLIFAAMAALLTFYVSALYKMQIYDTRPAEEASYPLVTTTRKETLTSARGNIYDRNGILLASGKPSYNISLDWNALRAGAEMNEIIQSLVYAAMEEDIQYTDTFPITRGAPFTYISNISTEQQRRLDEYFKFHSLDPEISESDFL